MSVEGTIDMIRRKVNAGLEAAVNLHVDKYTREVQARQTTPVGSRKRHGAEHNGQVVDRSQAGEFPRKEFFEASKHVRSATKKRKLQAASGVTKLGMPLIHLAYGRHMPDGEPFERLGPVDVWWDKQAEILAVMREFIDKTK